MRRTHQIGMEIGVGLLNIVTVIVDGVLDSADVIMGMVANAMTFADHTLIELRIFTDVVAHHEKSSLDVVSGQYIEHIGSGLGYGSVVKGQIDGLLVTVHTPKGFRIKPP